MPATTGSHDGPETAAARNAVRNLARADGTQASTAEIDPLAGLRASHALEQATRQLTRDYVRQARETGRSWRDIGAALALTLDSNRTGQPADELAYTYAAGPPDPDRPWRERSYRWHCRACDQAVNDTGPCNGPADDEHGHAPGCQQQARAIRAWDLGWEAGQ